MRITITPVNIALNTTSNKIIIYTSGCISGGSSGGGTWGSIIGTLSNQTDLQNALNAKANANNVLAKDNTTAFTPDADYEPSTKKYVDDIAITKVDKVTDKQLSTEDYTTAEKNKLASVVIPTYQTVTIAVADWSGGTTCTKTVSGVTATSYQTYYFASDASWLEAGAAKVRPTGQGVNSITFTAATTPTADISFNIEIKEV